MIAATLIDANQNSNSAYERADIRSTALITAINPTPSCQVGNGSHWCRILAPAIASTGTTMIQKYQYSQPQVKPAHGPKPTRANSVNELVVGRATAISPSMRITSSTSTPVSR